MRDGEDLKKRGMWHYETDGSVRRLVYEKEHMN